MKLNCNANVLIRQKERQRASKQSKKNDEELVKRSEKKVTKNK